MGRERRALATSDAGAAPERGLDASDVVDGDCKGSRRAADHDGGHFTPGVVAGAPGLRRAFEAHLAGDDDKEVGRLRALLRDDVLCGEGRHLDEEAHEAAEVRQRERGEDVVVAGEVD